MLFKFIDIILWLPNLLIGEFFDGSVSKIIYYRNYDLVSKKGVFSHLKV